MNKFIEIFLNHFNCSKLDIGDYAKMKVGPMTFDIECYDIDNIGRLSFMSGKAMLGLMKMDTIMFTSLYKDVPLFSYDRIKVLKNETLIIEMYDTCKEKQHYDGLIAVKTELKDEPKYQLKPFWYDEIRMDESIAVKNKKVSELYDEKVSKYITEFINCVKKAPDIGINEKKELQSKYVDGLLNNGGVSTDGFVKAIGIEKTTELYKKFLFGTQV